LWPVVVAQPYAVAVVSALSYNASAALAATTTTTIIIIIIIIIIKIKK